MKNIIAQRISAARKARGISRIDLAKAVHLHVFMIGQYERGDSMPSAATIFNLGKALDVPVDYLLDLDYPNKPAVAFKDHELFTLFNKIELLPPDKIFWVKHFMNAFVFKAEMEKQLSKKGSVNYIF